MALEGVHDAFIFDLGLPDLDGLDLIARCRAQGSSAPVLILSAQRSVDERVRGLEQGGDDYLTKPFALPELLARLRISCAGLRFPRTSRCASRLLTCSSTWYSSWMLTCLC
jgi:DNA-binding response OmpR family regulator